MTDYRKRLVEVVHGKPLSRVYCLSDATLIADLRSLLSEADDKEAEITRLRSLVEEAADGLILAANRMDRLALEMNYGSLLRDEAFDWSTAARSLLPKLKGEGQ